MQSTDRPAHRPPLAHRPLEPCTGRSPYRRKGVGSLRESRHPEAVVERVIDGLQITLEALAAASSRLDLSTAPASWAPAAREHAGALLALAQRIEDARP